MILLLSLLIPIVTALHADEAGINDFLLKSAGHGDIGVNFAKLVSTTQSKRGDVWVTSQSCKYPNVIVDPSSSGGFNVGGSSSSQNDNYCAISGRNVTTGTVLWRVNACASSSNSIDNTKSSDQFIPRHATLVSSSSTLTSNSSIFSLDNSGILRKWQSNNGALTIDTDILYNIDSTNDYKLYFTNDVPRLLDGKSFAIGTVLTKQTDKKLDDESLVLLDINTGIPIKAEGYHHDTSTSLLSAKMLLNKAKLKSKGGSNKYNAARIIDMHIIDYDTKRIGIWVGWSSIDSEGRNIGTFGNMALVEISLTSKPTSNDGETTVVYQIIRATPLNDSASVAASTPLLLSSLRMVQTKDYNTVTMMGIGVDKTQVSVINVDVMSTKVTDSLLVEIDVLHPYWRSIASIHIENNDSVVRITGMDDRYPIIPRHLESMFVLNNGGNLKYGNLLLQRAYGEDEEIHQDSLTYCDEMGMVVAASNNDDGYTVASTFELNGKELLQADHRPTWKSQDTDNVIVPSSRGGGGGSNNPTRPTAHLLSCSNESMTVVFTTLGGMTSAFQFDSSGMKQLWSSEEALGSISSAIFLDETHAVGSEADNADDEEEKALSDLKFSNRIKSQISSFQDFVFGGGAVSSLTSLALMSDEKKAERDMAFGFAKISVMLSEKLHRVVALDTARKGRVVWSMNLHPPALWHKLVHGGQFVSLSDLHGNGGVHDQEMLSLSYIETSSGSSVDWKCFDGTSGRVFASETLLVSDSVVQVVPLRSSTHHPHEAKSCRQVALLVHSDNTVSAVPDTARSYLIVDEAMAAATGNGLFVHTIDKSSGEFHALRVSRKNVGSSDQAQPFELSTVGTTIFNPKQEKIVNVAYPRRGEVIQSPSTVLGDDALLLKYLNPHIIVVVTEATKSFLSDVTAEDGSVVTSDRFYNALSSSQYSGSASGQKRKPLGASKPGGDVPSVNTASPSLFISLVDSVSGQILYRASHAHALESDITDDAAPIEVPVVISENWIVYSFFNQRTRRTDVGVLTLHEGMIDKNGITAFTAPEQELSFSSLESAKPIVLSKTYGLAKAITAIGVTTTKAGISSKQFLFATANDQVISIDRRLLDPRRPTGELKDSEKMEGLMKYSPLLPIMPLRTPSHVYEVSSVESIASASANVESQSLVIAYGGADVFFTRLAPSKGFDLLPDDFNRGLLSIVVLGLIVGLNVLGSMNKKKMVKMGWA